MIYPNLTWGIFHQRPNRFIAEVEVNGAMERVHVKNTGRCKELLLPGAKVGLVEGNNPNRKTKYDLVSVWKGSRLINMDSQAPNEILAEYLPKSSWFSPEAQIRREYTYGDSRFDIYVRDGTVQWLIEVKGVTLEEDGVARFPDAPTERGVKHIEGLIRAREDGYHTMLCFVVQMEGISALYPNDQTDPAFGAALRRAAEAGVLVRAMGCTVQERGAEISYTVPVQLEK